MVTAVQSSEVQSQSRPKTAPLSEGEFLRIEDKFIVDKSLLNPLMQEIEKHMRPSYPHPGTKYTMIESIYFDSRTLDFYKHDLLSAETRYKLRIRRYGPNGIWDNSAFHLELKRKRGDESKKVRFQVGPKEMMALNRGELIPVSDSLIQLNKGITLEMLQGRVDKINELILSSHIVPVRAIVYKRLAFEQGDFRLTIDTDLEEENFLQINQQTRSELTLRDLYTKAAELAQKFDSHGHLVLELKHSGSIPTWLQDTMQRLDVKKVNFSKYTYFMAKSVVFDQFS